MIFNSTQFLALVKKDLIIRYRRTLLGVFWTILNPLLMITISSIFFSTVFKMDLNKYVYFIFTGIIFFNFFSTSLTRSSTVFLDNQNLLFKINISKYIFVVSSILICLIDNLILLSILLLFKLFFGTDYSYAIFYLPFFYLFSFIFILGLSLIGSIVNVFFRDFSHLLVISLQALIFLSPVYYKPEEYDSVLGKLMSFNPLTYFIDFIRDIVFLDQTPSSHSFLIIIIISIFSLLLGISIYHFLNKKITIYL